MFCHQCGSMLTEADRFCPACGAAVNEAAPVLGGKITPQYRNSCLNQKRYPMRWFKFQLYFGIYVRAFWTFLYGILILIISMLLSFERFYHYRGLKTELGSPMFFLAAALLLISVVLAIRARWQLWRFRRRGIRIYFWSISIQFGGFVIMILAILQMTYNFNWSQLIIIVLENMVFFVLYAYFNYTYFRKRQSLFIFND